MDSPLFEYYPSLSKSDKTPRKLVSIALSCHHNLTQLQELQKTEINTLLYSKDIDLTQENLTVDSEIEKKLITPFFFILEQFCEAVHYKVIHFFISLNPELETDLCYQIVGQTNHSNGLAESFHQHRELEKINLCRVEKKSYVQKTLDGLSFPSIIIEINPERFEAYSFLEKLSKISLTATNAKV